MKNIMKDELSPESQSTSLVEAANFTEELDFNKYWLVLQRRWWIITIAAVACTGLGGFYALRQPKIYQANGEIVIRDDQAAQLTGIDAKTGVIKALTQKSDPLNTEAEILKSRPVLTAAVQALNLKDKKGNLLDAKRLAKELSVKPVVGADILQLTYKSEQPDVAAQIVNQVMSAYISNNVQVNQSQAEKAGQFIETELKLKEVVVREAEDALRRFREAHGLVALERETEESVKGMGLLNQNIDSSTALLSQAEARVSQLRSQVGMDVDQALQVNALNQSKAVQKAFEDWRQAQAELAKQRTVYQDSNPEVLVLIEQVKAAEAALNNQTREITGQSFSTSVEQLQLSKTQQDLVADLAKAEVDRTSLRQGLASLLQSRTQAVEKSRAIPTLEATQRELQRQVDAAQTTYKTLLAKLQEVQVAKNQTVGNARIISNAIAPDEPVGSSSLIILLASGIVGALLGGSVAFLVDYVDQSVKTLQEAKDLLPYPVLGMIPQVELSRQDDDGNRLPYLLTQDYPHFSAQEAYQMLQANLRFLPMDQSIRSVVVTSTMRQEGKSTVAANLAVAMAQGQRRVLLVDADMRHGCQHHVWGLSNQVGLSNLLVGQVQMDVAVTAVRANLHVLTAGTVPPNPLVLLDSMTMAMWVERFVEQYDFVIFDAPTLMGTADSAMLNRLVDGSLLVMRLGEVNAGPIRAMRQFVSQSGQRVLGVVMNGVDVKADRDGQFYIGQKIGSKTVEKSILQ
jgi:polysaccharide biosynthesis transport protein